MTKNKKHTTKVPEHYTLHWGKDGKFAGSWWLGGKEVPPLKFLQSDDFFAVLHPEMEIETTMLPCVIERRSGQFVYKLQEIDPSKFIAKGQKLSWRQRLKGIA